MARLPRWLHGTAGLSIPLGEHGMPSGSDSIADHRTSMQSQPAASILVVVLWWSQPGDPHHWRQETAQEERHSPAAEPGEAARDSCQTVSERRDEKAHLGAVERFVCRWVEICVAEYE